MTDVADTFEVAKLERGLAAPPSASTTPADDHSRRFWLRDFAWEEGRIRVRKTGVAVALDGAFFNEIANWAVFLAILWPVALWARLRRARPFAIWYAPDRPRPWYLMRGVALWSGFSVADRPEQADAAFYFEDVTRGEAPLASGLRGFNLDCNDVSKSHVAAVFEQVFGYPLSIDPRRAMGPVVEKSETNGLHDGRVISAPTWPRVGCAYQKVVDSTAADGFAYDLRTPCVDGRPVLVWKKRKPAGDRFTIHNLKATLHDPGEVYSPGELASIRRFTARMGLDWGGLDILRDRADGRIYIVDVNKTDLGPVIALSWRDKLRSMARLSRALRVMVGA